MSTFNVSDEHIRYLLRARFNYNSGRAIVDIEELRSAGVMLRNANVQSVNYRYGDSEPETRDSMCEPMVSTFEVSWADILNGPMTPVQAIKAIHCLRYQACETPDWRESPAFEWLEDLEADTINSLPGYDHAQWEIPDAPAKRDTIRRLI